MNQKKRNRIMMKRIEDGDQALLDRFAAFAREHEHESLEALRHAGLVTVRQWKDEQGKSWHRLEWPIQHQAVIAWRWIYDAENMAAMMEEWGRQDPAFVAQTAAWDRLPEAAFESQEDLKRDRLAIVASAGHLEFPKPDHPVVQAWRQLFDDQADAETRQ